MSVQILRVVGRKGIKAGVLATIGGHTVEYRYATDEWWCKACGLADDECNVVHVAPVRALIHPAVFGWSDA